MTSSNPLTQMANTLIGQRPGPTPIASQHIPEGITRTERIRRLLKCNGGPLTDNEIAWDMADHFPNFDTNRVWLLLKYDIKKGRVHMLRHGLYRWNEAFDTAQSKAIRAAEKLLKAHGYKVITPATQPTTKGV